MAKQQNKNKIFAKLNVTEYFAGLFFFFFVYHEKLTHLVLLCVCVYNYYYTVSARSDPKNLCSFQFNFFVQMYRTRTHIHVQ